MLLLPKVQRNRRLRVRESVEAKGDINGIIHCNDRSQDDCRLQVPGRSLRPAARKVRVQLSGMSLYSTLPYHPLCISKSAQAIRTSSISLLWRTRSHNVDHRASSKFFADAEQELPGTCVTSTQTGIHQGTTSEHPNWTGDESIEDTVLRMLVDKYKPLRTGTIRTAEEKMHRIPPQILAQQPAMTPMPISEGPPSIPSSSRIYRADEPLLHAVEGHKPWLTTFKVPSHATASIRYGHIPTASAASSSTPQAAPTDDDRTRRKEREVKKRSEIVGRLTRAKESTLDYRLGITKNIKNGMQAPPNPVSVKGWAGLVEARIEVRSVPSTIMKPNPSLSHPASKTRRTLPYHQGPREAP